MQAHSTQAAPATLLATSLKAPGTCGELMQGAIDEQDFLVNCPVNLFSHATVSAHHRPGLHLNDLNQFTKIRDAIALASQEYALTLNHQMTISSDIPRGKGMASSSADITAALEAICRDCGLSIPFELFARILTEIEPSDCVHFPGIAHVNHLTGQLIESMPAPNDMNVLIVDCGGEIDTIGFDRERARGVYRKNQGMLRNALDMLKRGLHTGNAAQVAQAATVSATLSQQIHFKPQFEELLAKTRALGALGVNCAHSGTVLGVLHRANEKIKDSLVHTIEKAFGKGTHILGDYKIISGGCYEC